MLFSFAFALYFLALYVYGIKFSIKIIKFAIQYVQLPPELTNCEG